MVNKLFVPSIATNKCDQRGLGLGWNTPKNETISMVIPSDQCDYLLDPPFWLYHKLKSSQAEKYPNSKDIVNTSWFSNNMVNLGYLTLNDTKEFFPFIWNTIWHNIVKVSCLKREHFAENTDILRTIQQCGRRSVLKFSNWTWNLKSNFCDIHGVFKPALDRFPKHYERGL